jgi:putative hydrolase of the HAD superfamily
MVNYTESTPGGQSAGAAPTAGTRPRPHVIAFDLDETLYPRDAGVMQAIGRRITEYLMQFMDLPYDDALSLRRAYAGKYGTTLRGLQIHHHIDSDRYMEFVHDVPVEALLSYDERLDSALAAIAAEKVVFTNASWEHAERVLQARGIRRHFARIIDVRDMHWVSKPDPSAYPRLLALLGRPAERSMLVEDNVRNLRPAAGLGMTTVLVNPRSAWVNADGDGDAVHFVIDEIWKIGDVYASLPNT